MNQLTVVVLILVMCSCTLGAYQENTKYACEHQDPVEISCPANEVILVTGGYYGRKETSRCGTNSNDQCRAEGSLSTLVKNCQNKNSCVLRAENGVFGDPCKGVVKFIKITYHCVQVASYKLRKTIACEHEDPVLAGCNDGEVMMVGYGSYGRSDENLCGGNKNTKCEAPQSTGMLEEQCHNKFSCLLNPSNSVYGDPCKGVRKYIELEYVCVPQIMYQIKTAIACENKNLKVSCPSGQVILVRGAFYGRDDSSTCPHSSIKTTDCKATKSYGLVKSTCDNKNNCVLKPSNSVFGDPCRGTYKYIKMTYFCA
ncbi:L-rhamnose-binding lectin CSL3-like [Clavelina lepadiformis]|uniref:L-rhamnose-binding lectin CSL3-like n=1 Tax=Clavelina lepadiformis TaxID=159417 RepID=UPI00404230CB